MKRASLVGLLLASVALFGYWILTTHRTVGVLSSPVLVRREPTKAETEMARAYLAQAVTDASLRDVVPCNGYPALERPANFVTFCIKGDGKRIMIIDYRADGAPKVVSAVDVQWIKTYDLDYIEVTPFQ